MSDEKPKVQQPTATPRTYLVSSEQLMDIMRYLMTRPYGEVVKLMNSLSALTPYNPVRGKDDGKK
jgi:hypothetical protein|tara:strand:- start:504 stop:698 length:195 start_codon:yes stop_codon:yes gene_type:complete